MRESTDVKIQPSAFVEKSQLAAAAVTSESLPKSVSMRLFELMAKITEKEITPASVNAACSCASEIHKILKLNLEIKKSGL